MIVRIDFDTWVSMNHVESLEIEVRETKLTPYRRCELRVKARLPCNIIRYGILRSEPESLYEGMQMGKVEICNILQRYLKNESPTLDLVQAAEDLNIKFLHKKWHRDVEKSMKEHIENEKEESKDE